MIRTLGMAVVLFCVAELGPDAAEPSAPDYRIAFWYLRADPLTSIKFQVYDVRKGEYSRTVDDWLETMRTRYPAYAAYVKDVRLDPQSGDSEKKQVATVVLQEFVAQGGPYGGYGIRDRSGIYGGGLDRLVSPGRSLGRSDRLPSSSSSAYLRGYGFVAAPGANRPPSFLLPPTQGIPTPFPLPIVRPHP